MKILINDNFVHDIECTKQFLIENNIIAETKTYDKCFHNMKLTIYGVKNIIYLSIKQSIFFTYC